jgi:hypothetical protein
MGTLPTLDLSTRLNTTHTIHTRRTRTRSSQYHDLASPNASRWTSAWHRRGDGQKGSVNGGVGRHAERHYPHMAPNRCPEQGGEEHPAPDLSAPIPR